MSGSVIDIPIEVAPRLLDEPIPKPTGNLQDLLGGTRARRLHSSELPVGLRLNQPLWSAYRAFLSEKIPSPWDASLRVLEYLEIIKDGLIQVRRRRGPFVDGKTVELNEWELAVCFSGCAGEAQTASEVAAHWAELWLARDTASLSAAVLGPAGIRPLAGPGTDATLFVPLVEYGYGVITEGSLGEPTLSLDHLELSLSDEGEGSDEAKRFDIFQKAITARALELTTGGRCLCQLCAPDFDPDSFLPGIEGNRTDRG
jgi:hypothetical protein